MTYYVRYCHPPISLVRSCPRCSPRHHDPDHPHGPRHHHGRHRPHGHATERTAQSTAAGRGGAAAHFAPWAAVRAAGGVAGPRPLPPLNVALVWYLHRLAPAAYAADTAAAFAASSHLPPADAATADADGGEGGGGATTDGWAGNAGCPAVVVARLQ